ncbi:BnaA03g58650D [Brassica napus]|uniref:BnaA03g58650D protein n=2 Tax=Brassica napus TaxID=3708 RepID=A0A078J8J9_BRANA|nr:BnaA03g58650D [Brassica napus]
MILVRADMAPGIPFDPQYIKAIDIAITKVTGNWGLNVLNEEIGFWPSSRFKESSGTGVEWGGEVYSPLSSPSPPMGNGRFPVGNPHYDSYIRDISIIDKNYKADNTTRK